LLYVSVLLHLQHLVN